MTIQRMKRVTFLVPRERGEELAAALQRLRLVHLEDFPSQLDAEDDIERCAADAESVESRLKELELIEGVFEEFAPSRRGFVESLVNVPIHVSADEMQRAVGELDVAPLFEECRRAAEHHRELQRATEHADAESTLLASFGRLPFDVSLVCRLRRVRVWIGSMSRARWSELQDDPWATDHLVVQRLFRDKSAIHLCVLALQAEREEADAVLKRYEFTEKPIPPLDVPVAQRVAELRQEAEGLRRESEALRSRVRELAAQRRQLAIVRAHWVAQLARIRAVHSGGCGRRVAIFSGYVRARDVEALKSALAASIPQASVLFEDPRPEDRVPVSVHSGAFWKPMTFLVRMFGMPDYFAFDPTPYLSLSFLVFFACCFGDAIYGMLLCAVAGYLAWKARRHEGLHDMCMLFLYCGVSTIIIGVLTGSWAGDLWQAEYLGEGNILLRIKERTALVDPLDKPVMMLLVALAMGVANQFYGIMLRGYGMLRRGNPTGALLDAGLWLLALPGFLITVSNLFFPTPGWVFHGGLALLAVGALGLVLSQGRHEPTLAGKAITGVVSLYGIVGTYGCVSFVGDMLSYSRLLALGLTTTIVGMSFNIMADLLRGLPWVGGVLFVGTLVLGHVFNFAVSILGAFVHSARLIFLEFFGRFYEAGGVRFRPLSVDTERVLVVNSPGGRT